MLSSFFIVLLVINCMQRYGIFLLYVDVFLLFFAVKAKKNEVIICFGGIYLVFRPNCSNFNLLHSLKIGGTSEKTKTKFCFFARFALSLHPKMKWIDLSCLQPQ